MRTVLCLLFLVSLSSAVCAHAAEDHFSELKGAKLWSDEHFEIWTGRDYNGQYDDQLGGGGFTTILSNTYFEIMPLYNSTPLAKKLSGKKIEIILTNVSQLAFIPERSELDLMGFFSPMIVNRYKENVVFVDPRFGLDLALVHRIVHEMQHLFLYILHPGEELWVNEGLSELLAWRIDGFLPTAAIDAFVRRQPKPYLTKNNFRQYGYADYGQSFLFMQYLRKKFLGDSIFADFSGQKAFGNAAVENILKERFKDRAPTFDKLYRDFSIAISSDMK